MLGRRRLGYVEHTFGTAPFAVGAEEELLLVAATPPHDLEPWADELVERIGSTLVKPDGRTAWRSRWHRLRSPADRSSAPRPAALWRASRFVLSMSRATAIWSRSWPPPM